MSWDLREYRQRRRAFLSERGRGYPMFLASSFIFAATVAAGWLSSVLLLHVAQLHRMPVRYAVSTLAAYAAFFGCVRLWCASVNRDRGNDLDVTDLGTVDGDGCLVVAGVLLAGAAAAAFFAWLGGFALLLEVAFEVVFAGTVVRRLSRTEIVGDWAGLLFARTWLPALLVLVAISGLAWYLQLRAPGATTLSAALSALMEHR